MKVKRVLRKPFSAHECVKAAWSPTMRALAGVGVLGILLSGCGVNRVKVAGDDIVNDARQRHPIAIVEKDYNIDIFPTEKLLDPRAREQIYDFAGRYKKVGHGPISILLPRGTSHSAHDARAVDPIRHELLKNGVGARVIVTQYQVADPALASPIRLTFEGIGAKVPHKCGEWPRDLVGASTNESWSNQPYYNFGCATQNMMATQIADPRDLASPRGEDEPDMIMQQHVIDSARK